MDDSNTKINKTISSSTENTAVETITENGSIRLRRRHTSSDRDNANEEYDGESRPTSNEEYSDKGKSSWGVTRLRFPCDLIVAKIVASVDSNSVVATLWCITEAVISIKTTAIIDENEQTRKENHNELLKIATANQVTLAEIQASLARLEGLMEN